MEPLDGEFQAQKTTNLDVFPERLALIEKMKKKLAMSIQQPLPQKSTRLDQTHQRLDFKSLTGDKEEEMLLALASTTGGKNAVPHPRPPKRWLRHAERY